MYGMKSNRKYTLELDESMVRLATKATGKSFTDTVRQGLKILISANAYNQLAEMHGTVDLQLDTKKIRKDKHDLR
jgi:hypothetical protein